MPLPNLETNDIEYMRRQFRAWIEGAEARANEFAKLSENPYPARTAEGDAWENGWERIDHGVSMIRVGVIVSSDHAFDRLGVHKGHHRNPDGTIIVAE